MPACFQCAIELCGKGIGGLELEAGDETVAEHDDADWCVLGLRGGAGRHAAQAQSGESRTQPIAQEGTAHHVRRRCLR